MSRDARYRGRKGFFNHKHDKRDQWSRGPDYLGADTPNWRSPVPEPSVGSVTTQAASTTHQDYADFLHKGTQLHVANRCSESFLGLGYVLTKHNNTPHQYFLGWNDFKLEKSEGSSVKVHQEEATSPRNPPIKLDEWIQEQSANTDVAS